MCIRDSYITGTDGTAIADTPVSAERLGVNYMDRDYVLGALRLSLIHI